MSYFNNPPFSTAAAPITSRASGIINTLPQLTTLTVSYAACNNVNSNPATFIYTYQKATSDAWNVANPKLSILPGDVVIDPTTGVKAVCLSSAQLRSLRSLSTITVVSSIFTPPGTDISTANAAGSIFQTAVNSGQAYPTTSQLYSNYEVIGKVTTIVDQASPQSYTAPDPSNIPAPASSSSNNIALAVGLGVGLGGAFLIIAVVVLFVVKRRQDKQKVAPSHLE